MDITTMTTFGVFDAARVLTDQRACGTYGHVNGTGLGSIAGQESVRIMPRLKADVPGAPPRGRPL